MTAHQQKKLNDTDLMAIRDRFQIPISDEMAQHIEFFRPPEDSPQMKYLRSRTEAMGGSLPARKVKPH
jgi:pyruvate dehydrogenase E1 component